MINISKYIRHNEDKDKFLHDYEKFAEEGNDETQKAYECFVRKFGISDDEDFAESFEAFESVYIGKFNTLEEFGLVLWDGAGFLNSIPEELHRFIDFRAYAEEQIFSGDVKRYGDYYFYTEW